MLTFERPLPTEEADVAEIVRAIGVLQARVARADRQPLARGTHAKGVCVGGEFEVFDLAETIADPVLRARLARGLFAQPGRYPAVVRFANGGSRVAADQKPDARALSFSVGVPQTLFGPEVTRVDFSMNDGPISPLNDAHAFAVVLRLLAARGLGGTASALWSLSWRDVGMLAAAGVRGRRLNRPGRTAYQRLRYWSVTPFRHGADEAVKYSAFPDPENPAQLLSSSPDALRDELIRHVAEDDRMAGFDFGLQLLDAAQMSDRRGRHDATYWVENASVEWPEAQAPFHVVGRLRLAARGHLSRTACAATYFDVTAHHAPGCEPLGSINRARGAAESASRRARLAQPAAAAAAPVAVASSRPRRSLGRRVLRVAAILPILAVAAFAALLYVPQWQRPALEPVDAVYVLDQGWGAGFDAPDRQRFYYTSQGAGLRGIRYSWFVNLELPWGRARVADEEHLSRYGFVYDPVTPANPDRLPVGVARFFDRQLNDDVLDVTCAACHTGEIHVTRNGRTTALRIDGGAALHYFNEALPPVAASMVSTVMNPFKFNRFARKVLGDDYPRGRLALHARMLQVLAGLSRLAWEERGERTLYPTDEGHGRTDALARIANMVFAHSLDPVNFVQGNAPVSYPPVWDIWKFDWVQYNASLSQPMARNIGEALGVGASFALMDGAGRPLPVAERFRSTASVANINTIETTLRKLRPPAWPEAVLGPVDSAKADRGRRLFDQYCVTCHGPHSAPAALRARNAPLKTAADPEWVMTTLCVEDIGTDPFAATNYANAFVDIRRTGLTADDLRSVARPGLEAWRRREATYLTGEISRLAAAIDVTPRAADATGPRQQMADLQARLAGLDAEVERTLAAIDPARIPVASALSYVGALIRQHAYADAGVSPALQDAWDGFGILDRIQALPMYKARPLAGIWSTAPFLHNGSVPTLFDLLSPVDERPTTFRMGSRAYDVDRMGLVGEKGSFVFDTSVPGNSNRGHEFGRGYVPPSAGGGPRAGLIGPYLEPDDRLAIIEYLKIRDDDADASPYVAPPTSYGVCGAGVNGPTTGRRP